jgi:hypothetical protein
VTGCSVPRAIPSAGNIVRRVGGGGVDTTIFFLPRGRHFADVVEVKRELLVAPDSISTEEFRQSFQQWEWHWDHLIQPPGEYYERDYSFIPLRKF